MAIFSFPEEVNEGAARTVAAAVASFLLVALLTQQRWIVPLIALGFLLRVGWGPKVSPLARAAVFLAPKFWTPLMVAGRPKRFAQSIGALLTTSSSALLVAGLDLAGWSVAAVVVVFETLEAVYGFCAGCFLYARLKS